VSTIELAGLSKHYGAVRAVDDVSLAVGQGEFVTILGPSGSGKTTLLSLIAGLVEPTAGRIVIGGRDVTDLPAARRNVGLVFQSYALFPNMSVHRNVAFPLEVRGVPRAEAARRVAEALRLVRLTGLEDRRPSQLSGGQQQRVALARAIVFAPAILLLDEPLAALDRKLREEVRGELRRLQRALGVTTLLVTHDQDEALSLSDWIVVLDRGRIQQTGPPDEAYRRPANRFVADFLGAANLFEGELQQRGDTCEVALADGERIPVGRLPETAGHRVCVLLRPERIVVTANGDGVPATVLESVYHGQMVRYQLRLASGREVVAVATDAVPRFAPATPVRLSWRPEDVWVMAEPESDAARAPLTPGAPAPAPADNQDRISHGRIQ
jgi:ABC-type Fe3+/spermidine/putrescine transport system ATPase subunit